MAGETAGNVQKIPSSAGAEWHLLLSTGPRWQAGRCSRTAQRPSRNLQRRNPSENSRTRQRNAASKTCIPLQAGRDPGENEVRKSRKRRQEAGKEKRGSAERVQKFQRGLQRENKCTSSSAGR